LFEDFEYKGSWWLPENPDYVLHGTLKFKHNNEIILELEGLFDYGPNYSFPRPEIILGTSNNGESITLFKTYEIHWSGFRPSAPEKNDFPGYSCFKCIYMLVNTHFNKPDDIKFLSLHSNFTYLDKWLYPKKLFKHKINTNKNTVEFSYPEKYEIKLNALNSTLSIVSKLSYGGDWHTNVQLCYKSFFKINPQEPKDLNWFEKFISDFANYLTLIIGYPIYPTILLAEGMNAQEHSELIKLYYIIPYPLVLSDISSREFEITFSELIDRRYTNDRFYESINEWFNQLRDLKPICELFYITSLQHLMYPRTYFLSLIQAIEAFHRRKVGDDRYLPRGEYRSKISLPVRNELGPILDQILDSLPEEMIGLNQKDDLKNSILDSITYSNRYSLITRLKLLCEKPPGSIWFQYVMNSDEMQLKKIVKIRNALTHSYPDSENDVPSDEIEFYIICEKLRILLKELLLHNIRAPWFLTKEYDRISWIEREEKI